MRKLRYLLFANPKIVENIIHQYKINLKDLTSISSLYFKIYGIDRDFINSLIVEVKILKENQSKESISLYSNYIQELVQFLGLFCSSFSSRIELCLSPSKILQKEVPDFLLSVVKTISICHYLKGEGILTQDISKEIAKNLKIENQWDRIIFVNNIPVEWEIDYIKSNICKIIQKNKGRILNPEIDIITNIEEVEVKNLYNLFFFNNFLILFIF